MAKNKNALRKHFIGPYSAENPETVPEKEAYMWIAKELNHHPLKTTKKTTMQHTLTVMELKKISSFQKLEVAHLKGIVITQIRLRTL